MATLSDKVQVTVTAMGLDLSTMKVTDFRTVREERMVMSEVRCPTCKGNKFVTRNEAGEVMRFDNINSVEAREARFAMKRRGDEGYCRTCSNPRKQQGYPQGVVKKMVTKMVTVHYPIWPVGTKFDSRFDHHDCGACGKNGIVTGTVPMVGTDANGTVHGMYVGQDCAGKFFETAKDMVKQMKKDADMVVER
jgi:hypothetical protein